MTRAPTPCLHGKCDTFVHGAAVQARLDGTLPRALAGPPRAAPLPRVAGGTEPAAP